MPNDHDKKLTEQFYKGANDFWSHFNSPSGGGGAGGFTQAGSLKSSFSFFNPLPHPNSPAACYLTPEKIQKSATAKEKQCIKSGKYWVSWAEKNAKNSNDIDELEASFKTNAVAFINALKEAGASVQISTTTRSAMRAYLFHWSWKISQGKCKASDATQMKGVDIDWDHHDDEKTKSAALEMVNGFGLAIPPKSTVAPSLTSNHIVGKAIDLTITWKGEIKIKKKDNSDVAVAYMTDVNANTTLHEIGKSYGVIKHTKDAPHWSFNGR